MLADPELEPPVSPRTAAVLAAVLLVPGLAYVVAVLLPYLASDLDRLPLADLADGTSDLGTQPSPTLLGFAALLLAPLGAMLALGGAVVELLSAGTRGGRRPTPVAAAALGLVALAAMLTLLWFLSPLGRALTGWQLD